MNWALKLVAAIVLGIFAFSGDAQALGFTVHGTITDGIDYDGVFGPDGGDLTGSPVTLTFGWVFGTDPHLSYGLKNYGAHWSGGFGLWGSITIGSSFVNYPGSNQQSVDFSHLGPDGHPTDSFVTNEVNNFCTGKFAIIGRGYECKTWMETRFDLLSADGGILTQEEADTLAASVIGGTITIYPLAAALPYGPSLFLRSETFTFTTAPEPATWSILLLGVGGLLVRSYTNRRSR